MQRIAVLLAAAVLFACLPGRTAEERSDFDPLLARLHLKPAEAQLDPSRWRAGGKYALPGFNRVWNDWRLLDPYAVDSGRRALSAASSFRRLLDCAAGQMGVAITPPKPTAHRDADLAAAVVALQRYLGAPLPPDRVSVLRKQAATVPPDVRRAAVTLIRAIPPALDARRRAFAKYGDDKALAAIYDHALSFGLDFDPVDTDMLKLIETIDFGALFDGARILAEAMDSAGTVQASARRFHFECETPLGRIALNGARDDVYDAPPYLAIVDTGGNDRYLFGKGADRRSAPISLIVDAAGNDTYVSSTPGAFGAGILGYGFLLDCQGDDTYSVRDAGIGCGIFGVGMAIDRAGRDRYQVHRMGEGAGTCGVGVLADLAGNDEYHCMMEAQGFGGVRGCGILADRSGNDLYDADDTHLENPSPQTAQHNVSMAQGAGFGRRANPGDGHSMAGGVGLLADGGGNDTYRCGVFGQGTGYWYSLGMLVDFGGDDTYTGVWYVQGSSAHYAVAALCDLGGNDRYTATMYTSQGQGHDYSIGLLHDYAGNDVYSCQSACVGSGRYNGIGLFEDPVGHDVYKTGSQGIGEVADSRPESLCLGLFIGSPDATFPREHRARPHTTWITQGDKAHPKAHAIGTAGG